MARYQPKVMHHAAWYYPTSVDGSQVPWGSGPQSDIGSMTDLQAYHQQFFLPRYANSAYSSVNVANLQQNNAMPLLTYGRHGSNPLDCVKPFAYIQSLPRALLGQPLPHMQTMTYDYSAPFYPHFFRSHPYSFVRRSSSSSSQNHLSETGQGSTENNQSHVNNHSSTGRGSRLFQIGATASERHHSRSVSTCSNRNSPVLSVNSASVSDGSVCLNEITSTMDTASNAPESEDSIIQNKDNIASLHTRSDFPSAQKDELSKSANISNQSDDKNAANTKPVGNDYQNMGDHPSIAAYSNPNQLGLKGQSYIFGAPTGADGALPAFSAPSLCSDQTVVESSRDDSAPQQRHRQPTVCLPLTSVGRPSAQVGSIVLAPSRGLQMIANGPLISPGAPLSLASAQPNISSSLYMEALSLTIWQFYTSTRQSKAKYTKKVHLRNALLEVVSGVFKNAGLFIVGSSMNGFGSDQSDMDMCLTVTSQDLQQKKEAFAVLSQLLPPLRNCSFIRNLNLIRAKVPILKFRDTLAGVDCDLNVNNVVGIYNTHLLAMYTRIDWRVRPLGMFVKYWAQRMDIHDGSRGRLSTYPLLLMLIHYLQASCTPPILPNLQAKFPKIFNYACPLSELDMRLELPWAELRSNNPASLAELFVGFINYYTNEFDFTRWAVSVRNGAPLPIDMAIRRLPPHEQAHTARSFKVFVEEPFCQSNAARSLYDDNVLSRIRQAFVRTHQALRAQRPLETIWVNATNEIV